MDTAISTINNFKSLATFLVQYERESDRLAAKMNHSICSLSEDLWDHKDKTLSKPLSYYELKQLQKEFYTLQTKVTEAWEESLKYPNEIKRNIVMEYSSALASFVSSNQKFINTKVANIQNVYIGFASAICGIAFAILSLISSRYKRFFYSAAGICAMSTLFFTSRAFNRDLSAHDLEHQRNLLQKPLHKNPKQHSTSAEETEVPANTPYREVVRQIADGTLSCDEIKKLEQPITSPAKVPQVPQPPKKAGPSSIAKAREFFAQIPNRIPSIKLSLPDWKNWHIIKTLQGRATQLNGSIPWGTIKSRSFIFSCALGTITAIALRKRFSTNIIAPLIGGSAIAWGSMKAAKKTQQIQLQRQSKAIDPELLLKSQTEARAYALSVCQNSSLDDQIGMRHKQLKLLLTSSTAWQNEEVVRLQDEIMKLSYVFGMNFLEQFDVLFKTRKENEKEMTQEQFLTAPQYTFTHGRNFFYPPTAYSNARLQAHTRPNKMNGRDFCGDFNDPENELVKLFYTPGTKPYSWRLLKNDYDRRVREKFNMQELEKADERFTKWTQPDISTESYNPPTTLPYN